jgi:hypothetical protein
VNNKTRAVEQETTITVDSGQILIGDPCYALRDSGPEGKNGLDYQDLIKDDRNYPDNRVAALPHIAGHNGLGVLVNTGDGVFSVSVKRANNGRLLAVTVHIGGEEP